MVYWYIYMYILKYAIVGRIIDSYLNIYEYIFNKLFYTILASVQHELVDICFLIWMILINSGITFLCWLFQWKIVIYIKKYYLMMVGNGVEIRSAILNIIIQTDCIISLWYIYGLHYELLLLQSVVICPLHRPQPTWFKQYLRWHHRTLHNCTSS